MFPTEPAPSRRAPRRPTVAFGEGGSGTPITRRACRAVVAIALASALMSGCAAREFNRLMRDWERRPLSQLLTTWGPPTSVYGDGMDGYVIAYVPNAVSRPSTVPRVNVSGSQLAYEILHEPGTFQVYTERESMKWPVYRLFFVDSAGAIYASRWKGKWVCCGI